MAPVALTGARGFLGWHTRCAALVHGSQTTEFRVGADFALDEAAFALSGASRFVHIAGVNRGTDAEVRDGNRIFAEQAVSALHATDAPPAVVVFANSTQIGNGSVYAEAKAEAANILRAASDDVGARFVDVALPNLFGEHGSPFYNSVVSTFCHLLATGGEPTIAIDKEMSLLHAQDAADLLLLDDAAPLSTSSSVSDLLATLRGFASDYQMGEIPLLDTEFRQDLFNTYRSYVFADRPLVPAQGASDEPTVGVSVAGHFHRRAIERVSVLGGHGTLRLQRLFAAEQLDLELGAATVVDIPTLWTQELLGDVAVIRQSLGLIDARVDSTPGAE
jgi:UDP-2-acetamido-2,6-beta-L-arabino-hexul-4-ose reductase